MTSKEPQHTYEVDITLTMRVRTYSHDHAMEKAANKVESRLSKDDVWNVQVKDIHEVIN